MNLKEYISSGIIESYVMGLASEQDRAEFEQLCASHPELVEARRNFELLLEKKAMELAEAPPASSKNKIWAAIQDASATNSAKVITMEPSGSRSSSAIRWVAAASVILMLAAGYFAYDNYKQKKNLELSNQTMQAKLNEMDSTLQAKAEQDRIMHDPNVTVVNLKAMKPAAPSASVYWDTTSSNVYLVVKNMPKLASERQYQLWSIIDSAGKLSPTSLGLFDGGNEKMFFKLPNVQRADAFAITIEKAGNSGGPDMSQLQNKGNTGEKL